MMRKAVISVLFLTTMLFSFSQVSLVETMRKLEENTELSFSYDADLISEVMVDQKLNSIEDLNGLLANSALRLEEIEQDQYLLVPIKTRVQLFFENASQAEELQPFYVDIVRGNQEVLYQDFITDPSEPVSFLWTPKPGDSITVVSTAYESVQVPVSELIINPTYRASLNEKVTYLEEVVIENYLAKGIELDVSNHVTSIKMDELALIPGETDGDVLASMATLPGINTPDSRPGNLFIRGSSTDQNFLLFNNIPIYHRGHFFGSISPYNPSVISEVRIHKNGFHPRLGGRVGGAIEMVSQDSLRDYKSYGFGINSLYGNAFARHKLSKRIGVSLAARRSLPSSFSSPKLQEISDMVYAATALTDPQLGFDLDNIDVVYEDYNANLVVEPAGGHWIKLSGLLTNNETFYLVDNDSTVSEETLDFGNNGISAQWKFPISKSIEARVSGYHSDYNSTYSSQNVDTQRNERSGDFTNNEVKDTQAGIEFGRAGRSEVWRAGISSQWLDVSFFSDNIIPGQPPSLVQGQSDATILSAYGNYNFDMFGDFYFQIGGRGSLFSATDKLYLSPRLLVNYDIAANLILKGSSGRYYQFLNQIKFLEFGNAGFDNEMWRLADGDEIDVLYSDQFMLGSVFTKGKWVFDLELFKKRISNINYSTTPELVPMTSYGNASWDINGFDLFTKVQVGNGLSLWGSYEYTEQLVTFDSLESVSYQYKYNQPHRFKLGGLYQSGRWKLSFSYKILSGLYGRSFDILTQLDDIVIREVASGGQMPPAGGGTGGMPPGGGGGGMPGGGGTGGMPPGGGGGGMPPSGGGMQPPGQPRTVSRPATIDDIPERYETFSSLDIFITYHLPESDRRKWSATFGLSLINIFNNENQIDQVVRGGAERNLLERNAIGFSPNLNMTITW